MKRTSALATVLGVALLKTPLLLAQGPAQPSLRDFSDSLEALAAQVRPSVVQIFSTGYVSARDDEAGSKTGALLSTQVSTGSGVILTADGYIVTNNHVVQGARKIEVRLPTRTNAKRTQGMTLPAKVTGIDQETDLAVIKIDYDGLTPLSLGDSDQLRQGQVVMAFGNPLGLEGSVSMGIVSSTGRQIKTDDPLTYIQTDAPINPGNSGGPLVDTRGRVMGINALIFTQSGGSEGIGFAIPSNTVRTVYNQIRKDGHVHRGHIGVSVQSITPTLAKGLKLGQDWGVVVSDVEPGGSAEKAGLKPGDVIQTLDGASMESASELENAIYRLTASEHVDLTVLRAGQTVNLMIPVHQREDDPERFADMVNSADNLVPELGILAIELDSKLAAMLPGLRHEFGLVVAARGSGAPYTGGNLETGDVIYEINNVPALSVKALRAELASLKAGGSAVLQVERGGRLMYIPIELE